jgi:hypothetical protein
MESLSLCVDPDGCTGSSSIRVASSDDTTAASSILPMAPVNPSVLSPLVIAPSTARIERPTMVSAPPSGKTDPPGGHGGACLAQTAASSPLSGEPAVVCQPFIVLPEAPIAVPEARIAVPAAPIAVAAAPMAVPEPSIAVPESPLAAREASDVAADASLPCGAASLVMLGASARDPAFAGG